MYREFIKYGAKMIRFSTAPESRRSKILSAEVIAAFHATNFSEDETSDKEGEDVTELETKSDNIFENVTEINYKKIETKGDKNEDIQGESFPLYETKTAIICTETTKENLAKEIFYLTNDENIIKKIISNDLENEIPVKKTVLLEIFDEKNQLTINKNIHQGLKKIII